MRKWELRLDLTANLILPDNQRVRKQSIEFECVQRIQESRDRSPGGLPGVFVGPLGVKICRLVQRRVLKSKMKTVRIISLLFRVLRQKI